MKKKFAFLFASLFLLSACSADQLVVPLAVAVLLAVATNKKVIRSKLVSI